MKLDISALLRGETRLIEFDYMLTPESVDNATFTDDAHVTGKVTDNGGYIRLHLDASVPFHAECARCLSPISDIFRLSMDLTVAVKGSVSDKELEENMDEYAVVTDGFIDIDEQIREAIILDFPMRFLCDENCPGLCPECGKRLADGDCGCSKKKKVDPRFNSLLEIISKMEDDENDVNDDKR
ncbi:MAG: DUF177 domain-containing protein [Clostridia bacterium]|nr:DUF177 domain-containing protein [Clostridia bacterium]MDY3784532.1 DUF177 domain-containing protein [Eubacteriales bacterium]